MEPFWKRSHSFLTFVALLSSAASVKYTKSPPASVTLLKGQSYWFPWQYDLEGNTLFIYECYFKNKTDSVQKIVEGKTTFTIVSPNPKYVAYKENKTFAVMNVSYPDSGKYYCLISSTDGKEYIETKSNETSLSVEDPTQASPDGGAGTKASSVSNIVGCVICSIIFIKSILT